MKARWADPCVLQAQLWYTVVTTEKMFQREMRKMGYSKEMTRDTNWLAGGGACVQKFDNAADDGRHVLLVSIKPIPSDPTQVMGLLVHEAVHVWEHILEALGEKQPSSEMQAYGIQGIFLQLFQEYARQTAIPAQKRKK